VSKKQDRQATNHPKEKHPIENRMNRIACGGRISFTLQRRFFGLKKEK